MALRSAVGGGALDLGTVTLPQLLHLVAALNGGLGVADGAPSSDVVGDLLPVAGPEIPTAERIPLVSISINESHGLIVGPARRGQAAGGSRGGDGDCRRALEERGSRVVLG